MPNIDTPSPINRRVIDTREEWSYGMESIAIKTKPDSSCVRRMFSDKCALTILL